MAQSISPAKSPWLPAAHAASELGFSALDECGAVCVVNYVADPSGKNEGDAKQIAAEIDSPHIVQCDVGNPSEIAAMMRYVQDQLGGLDILVNNAGILAIEPSRR